jgi:putative two-component system response regulator
MELLARVRSLLKVKAYNDLMSHYRKELESEVTRRTEELKHAFGRIKAASLDTIYPLSMASEYKDADTGAYQAHEPLLRWRCPPHGTGRKYY